MYEFVYVINIQQDDVIELSFWLQNHVAYISYVMCHVGNLFVRMNNKSSYYTLYISGYNKLFMTISWANCWIDLIEMPTSLSQ